VTIGGVLAVGGHGSGVPAMGEMRPEGKTFGSLSNLVTAIEVVAWSPRVRGHRVRRIERDDPLARPVLAHLGRAFVTAVELRTGADANLRCESFTDIPWSELCGARGRTAASFLDQAGRIEIIWFPYTSDPWLKVWSVAPAQPPGSRLTEQPYNYPFSDNIPDEVAVLAGQLTAGNPAAAPLFGQLCYSVTDAGLTATGGRDLWGRSRNTLLYLKPTTLRYIPGSWAIHCRRADVQDILGDLMRDHAARLAAHRARDEFPINGPVEIRVTGVDRAADVGIPGAVAPAFAPTRRRRPEWDTVIWFSVLSFVGSPATPAYLRETERRLYARYPGAVVPEWCKGWAYTDAGAWRDRARFPRLNAAARRSLHQLDPHRVFSNTLLDRVVP
jgi:FAD/FMN-containing dehydrogenase